MNTETTQAKPYPVNLTIPYPGQMSRWKTLFRIILIIPAAVLLACVGGGIYSIFAHFRIGFSWFSICPGGVLILPPLLAIVFRKRYPRWWYDWNLALRQFVLRVGAYLYLLTEKYPAMDQQQDIHFSIEYPQPNDLHRFLPLVKWLLAIPHLICLAILGIVFAVVWIMSWIVAIIIGRVPRSFFNYMVGYLRWVERVGAYCVTMLTDRYPPFFSNFHSDENKSH